MPVQMVTMVELPVQLFPGSVLAESLDSVCGVRAGNGRPPERL